MSPSSTMIGRALWRVGLSSAGEVAGRAVNLLLPFALFAVHSVDARMDGFFLAVAVAFFFQGSLANALVSALVPLLVQDRQTHTLRGLLRWSLAGGLLAGALALGLTSATLSPATVMTVLAVVLMAASGLIAAPAVAVLNADHRYGMPGLTWMLRVVPVVLYLTMRPDVPALHWLMLGLALSDAGRAAVLLTLVRGRLTLSGSGVALHLPPAAAHLMLASAVAGLTPLIARWLASLGEPGGVSLFEAADRLYSALASLATIGVGNVTLVYLARLTGTKDEHRGWRWILWSSMAWSLLWLALSIVLWVFFPVVGEWFHLQSRAALAQVRDAFLALALGIPAFIMTGVLGRRLLIVGRAELFMPITMVGVAFSTVIGWLMFSVAGPAGIGVALSGAQYLVMCLMGLAVRKGRDDAHSCAV